MKNELIPEFIQRYGVYKLSEEYKRRSEQLEVVPIFRDIIRSTLNSGNLSDDKLTGFIQMFKPDVTEGTFDKYLQICISDKNEYTLLLERWNATSEKGLTGAGLNSVTDLSRTQLNHIRTFLLDAFEITSTKKAIEHCQTYESRNIPYIKSGVYSPWLYYINPTVFPILNNSHINFRKWIEIPSDYPSCLEHFTHLKNQVNELDFGLFDRFTHNFNENGPLEPMRVLKLQDRNIYKISHGDFAKKPNYRNTGILEILKENNWICMHINTGKGQGSAFKNKVEIGDFVYVVNGQELGTVGRIISEAKPLPVEIDELVDGDQMWYYRVIEPVCHPINISIKDLIDDKRFFMPSGYSTFYRLPVEDDEELKYLNDALFKAKYNLKLLTNETMGKNQRLDKTQELSSLNTILYGPPGTGKTFHSLSYAVSKIENKSFDEVKQEAEENRDDLKERYDALVENGNILFTTFHQSLSYEDFIEGIKPLPPEKDQAIKYDIKDGIFKEFVDKAKGNWLNSQQKNVSITPFEEVFEKLKEEWEENTQIKFSMKTVGKEFTITGFTNRSINFKKASGGEGHTLSIGTLRDMYYGYIEPREKGVGIYYPGILQKLKPTEKQLNNLVERQNYVIIIDEINRGNVSQIFGELITLIEEDKRMGSPEALKTRLPYTPDYFEIPPNVFIVGTMNTADRSVEALDTALRRRFSFVPMMPDESKLKATTDGINLPAILTTLNKRLRVLKDNDHTVGHAWFWNVQDLEGLKQVFANKVLPLLQEYFYNDYEKLGLLLGDAFFEKQEQVSSNIFANFSGGNGLAGQYEQSWQFELKAVSALTIDDFKTLEQ